MRSVGHDNDEKILIYGSWTSWRSRKNSPTWSRHWCSRDTVTLQSSRYYWREHDRWDSRGNVADKTISIGSLHPARSSSTKRRSRLESYRRLCPSHDGTQRDLGRSSVTRRRSSHFRRIGSPSEFRRCKQTRLRTDIRRTHSTIEQRDKTSNANDALYVLEFEYIAILANSVRSVQKTASHFSLNFETVAMLSKFICLDSEVCFWVNSIEGIKCMGFWGIRKQIFPDCLLCYCHASSSSEFGFPVYPCSLVLVPRPGSLSEGCSD